jgi:hypothetical protein
LKYGENLSKIAIALKNTSNRPATKNPVFQGNVPIENGSFSTTFIVPKDIHYGGTDGRISLYFHDDQTGGTGVLENIPVGGTAIDLVDHHHP